MYQVHKFIKDDAGWAISLPGTIFSRGARAMVAGADDFLDILAQGETEVNLALSIDEIKGWNVLSRTKIHEPYLGESGINGADYIINSYMGIDYQHTMWLCALTMWVFGGYYPKTIFFQVH